MERALTPGALRVVFQPIFDLSRLPLEIVAVEGLTRGPADSNLVSPDVLFEFARRKREEAPMDRAAVTAILEAARDLPKSWRIQVNVHAATLVRDPEFTDCVLEHARRSDIAPERLVIEVIEHWSRDIDMPRLLAGLDRLRQAGIEYALDDVGAGAANLGLILTTSPTLLKIDRSLVNGVARNARLAAALRAVQALAAAIGARLVVEGIESADDLEFVRRYRIEMAQGFLLARPAAAETLHSLPAPRTRTPRIAA
jgi:EAL domain-containing protein (putative c-di-GMP-specific phosphodiesterase class I)